MAVAKVVIELGFDVPVSDDLAPLLAQVAKASAVNAVGGRSVTVEKATVEREKVKSNAGK